MPSFASEPQGSSARRSILLPLGLAALALAAACGTSDAQVAPKVVSTSPAASAIGVALNTKVSASFDSAMSPLGAVNFTLKQGTTPVAGAVALSADLKTATFAPANPLAASTLYSATVTAAAASASGVALGSDHAWSFTTGLAADTTPPQVSSTSPAANATAVPINAKVSATFNKALDATTATNATFTVTQGTAAVAGSVTYGPGTIATFTPASALAGGTLFTATLSTGVKDLAGNALAAIFTWTFTTGTTAAIGPALVGLGTAGNYVALAKTGISSVPTSAVTGDIGLGPAAASFITGFSLVADATNVFSTSTQLVGKAYAADYAVPTPTNLTTAVSNMEGAYTDAAGRVNPDHLELSSGNVGGLTLAPGLYKWTSTVTIPTDVTISGGANDTWIFQTTGDLSMSASKNVILSGGAQAKNIFWQVAGKATIGAGAHFEGVLLCKTDVALLTGASMKGRILAQTQIALQAASLTQP